MQRWWSAQLQAGDAEGWRRGRDASGVAAELRRNAQFEMSQAGFLHRRPDAGAAREVVATLSPVPSEDDAELLVEAVVRAGATAQKVRATTVVGAVLTVAALVVRNVLRGR